MPNFNLEIKSAVEAIKAGKLILFPTDTCWSIGCDANNASSVEKLLMLKQNDNPKNITCLVADDRMLGKYVKQIPDAAQSIIEIADTPTTIVYDMPQNLATNLYWKNNTIAIRIPDDEFCYQLLRRTNCAIATSLACIEGEASPKYYEEIAPTILKGVDYVVNLQMQKNCTKPASIIQIDNSSIVKILRK
ncbi:translation factor Sua5 [Hyunsoonleella flava]|uniref:L-threonylcarbamoyladenylate synthase n=1 Tax=Hyunsoonleella flava TaxID=2527939 RepID=A0A4Q9FH69_9FLAO|nr:Sua5/YciO/YrdC/YwlC family protein [Hyunsoonleella flava]TBN06408.1 translation factor Sua5 [Hyunsoonleella flava]